MESPQELCLCCWGRRSLWPGATLPAASPPIPDTTHLPWHSPRPQHSAEAWSQTGCELLAKPGAGARQGPGGSQVRGCMRGSSRHSRDKGPRMQRSARAGVWHCHTALQACQVFAGERGGSHKMASICWQIRDNFGGFPRAPIPLWEPWGGR